IVVGNTESNDLDVSGNHGNGTADWWVLYLKDNGELLWKKTFGGSQNDYAYDVKQTRDGGFIIVGTTSSSDGNVSGFHGGLTDAWIVKLNQFGNIEWQKCLGGT